MGDQIGEVSPMVSAPRVTKGEGRLERLGSGVRALPGSRAVAGLALAVLVLLNGCSGKSTTSETKGEKPVAVTLAGPRLPAPSDCGYDLYRVDLGGASPTRIDAPQTQGPVVWSRQGLVAFSAGDTDPVRRGTNEAVFIADPRTDGPARQITNLDFSVDDRNPAWSPSGDHLAFTRHDGSGSDVWVVDRMGKDVGRLTDAPGSDAAPVWSADGTKIYFSSDRRTADSEPYVMDADGTNQRPLTDTDIPAVVALRSESRDVYALNVGGTETRNLTNSPGAVDHVEDIARDGQRVAVMSLTTVPAGGASASTFSSLIIIDLDAGSAPRVAVDPVDGAVSAAFSPDGRRIAYTASGQVFVADAGNLATRKVVSSGDQYADDVLWSPDGTMLAFGTDRGVSTVRPDGSGLRRLTDFGRDAVWSSDGTSVVFRSCRDS